MAELTKNTLEHLAKLARINLDAKEETKLLADLQNILNYFEELKGVETNPASAEATAGKRVTGDRLQVTGKFREDTERENTNQGKGKDQFPEKSGEFLKVPPVFE